MGIFEDRIGNGWLSNFHVKFDTLQYRMNAIPPTIEIARQRIKLRKKNLFDGIRLDRISYQCVLTEYPLDPNPNNTIWWTKQPKNHFRFKIFFYLSSAIYRMLCRMLNAQWEQRDEIWEMDIWIYYAIADLCPFQMYILFAWKCVQPNGTI